MSRRLRSRSPATPTSVACASLVSPFMNFNTTTKTTDLIMFNSRNLGALIVDEKPRVKSWDEPQYSIQNLGNRGMLRVRCAQRRSGNHRRQECPPPPERDVDTGTSHHLCRFRQHQLRAPAEPRRRGADRSDQITTSNNVNVSAFAAGFFQAVRYKRLIHRIA